MELEAAIQGFEGVGRSEPEPVQPLSAQQRFGAGRRALNRRPQAAVDADARLVELEITVDRMLTNLTRAAVIQSVRAGHDETRIFRVSQLARNFAEAQGMMAARLRSLQLATKLMDIGNMGISDRLLRKPCDLTSAERQVVDEHAALSAELLVSTQLAMFAACVHIARFHHERWDGRGPSSLAGERIPFDARVASLCDAFDALTHDRPWRSALATEAALRTLESEAGKRFDPELCRVFVSWVRKQTAAGAGLGG